MFLDPEFLPVYEVLPALDVFADVPGARAAASAASGDGRSDSAVDVEDRVVPANGHPLSLRLSTPASRGVGPLPPTYIMAAGVDPARDEALEFAARLGVAGNSVEVHLVPGVPHMFDVLAPAARVTCRAVSAWTAAFADGIGATCERGHG
ncbi:alpha/beta hydrolase [Streptomyces tubercidicus]